jgi:hypothetical protein
MSIIKPLFLGILAAFFALVVELSFSLFSQKEIQAYIFTSISLFLVLSVLAEEVLKYSIILKSFSNLQKRSYVITSGLILGLGFSAVEISLNLSGHFKFNSANWLYLAGIIFVHLVTCGFSAYLISKKQNVYFITARALIINSIIHLSYNLAIIYLF